MATATTASPSTSVLIRGSTTVALLAAIVLLVWLPRDPQTRILATVPVTSTVSLLVTFRYEGPADNTSALWILVESVALLAVTLPAVRWPAPMPAAAMALIMLTTITLLPLRIALTIEPPSGPQQTLVLCTVWALAAVVAVGTSCYLRSLDYKRRHALVAERRAQRLQVARDLHDFAAHDVTGVMVLAQAAQTLAPASPERALALLPQIETASIQALKSMDRTIRILSELGENRRRGRDGEGPTVHGTEGGPAVRTHALTELPGLIDQFGRTGMIPARLDLAPGTLDGLPEGVSSVGYRVVMEALTNVRRHAPASPGVTVTAERTVRAGAAALRLVVDNEPASADVQDGPPAEREGGGTGIRELGKRVAELGGDLIAGPAPHGGWRLTAVFTLDVRAEDTATEPAP